MIFSIDPVLKTFDPSTLGGAGERLRIVPGPLHTFQVSLLVSFSLPPPLSLRAYIPRSLPAAPLCRCPCAHPCRYRRTTISTSALSLPCTAMRLFRNSGLASRLRCPPSASRSLVAATTAGCLKSPLTFLQMRRSQAGRIRSMYISGRRRLVPWRSLRTL